jgi:hypothetical protein
VPLANAEQIHRHGGIVVNGKGAASRGMPPTFSVAQVRRAATPR